MFHIDDDMSYHLSIVLRCFEEKRVRRNRRRKQFENIWSFDSSCEDIIRGSWAAQFGGGLPFIHA